MFLIIFKVVVRHNQTLTTLDYPLFITEPMLDSLTFSDLKKRVINIITFDLKSITIDHISIKGLIEL